jgi:hypothetical protein
MPGSVTFSLNQTAADILDLQKSLPPDTLYFRSFIRGRYYDEYLKIEGSLMNGFSYTPWRIALPPQPPDYPPFLEINNDYWKAAIDKYESGRHRYITGLKPAYDELLIAKQGVESYGKHIAELIQHYS